ncbi:aspartate aminotransferase family protein [Candidatus Uhrbacteria bacterium]|nr:aspartate aminotransferase family protein [Candidatus Uhrbacteria bacterium]
MSPRSSDSDLEARASAALMKLTRYWPDDPLTFVTGHGSHLCTPEGEEYLDLFGGVATVSVGYGNPHLASAIAHQAGQLIHMSELYLNPVVVAAAERLGEIAPRGLTKCRFVNSGSEANELAANIVMRATGKTGLLALEHAYHGRTPIARSLTYQQGWRNAPPYVHNVQFVPNPYALRRPKGMGEPDFYRWCLDRTEAAIKHAHGGAKANFAGLWVEPIQGNGGVIMGPSRYYDELIKLVHAYGGLVVADEVQTGFGRTGLWFGCQHWSETPDIVVMAKGIAGGFPMGAVSTTPGIAAAMDDFLDFNTYGGNPLACAAMLATIEEIESLRDNIGACGAQLAEGLCGLVREFPVIAEVRGQGLMLGVEFDDDGTLDPNPKLMAKLHMRLRERHVLVGKGGPEGNIMRIKPPYCLTEQEADTFLVALRESLEQIN